MVLLMQKETKEALEEQVKKDIERHKTKTIPFWNLLKCSCDHHPVKGQRKSPRKRGLYKVAEFGWVTTKDSNKVVENLRLECITCHEHIDFQVVCNVHPEVLKKPEEK